MRSALCLLLLTAWTTTALGQVVMPPVPVPAGNELTPAKVVLGKALFWDEQLSSTRNVACGTCHIPEAGGADPRTASLPELSTHPGADGLFGTADDVRGSPGVIRHSSMGEYLGAVDFGLNPQVTPRRAPSTINAAFHPLLFWDGRADEVLRDPINGGVVLAAGAALENQALGPPVNDVEMGHVGSNWVEVVWRIRNLPPLGLADQLPAELAAAVEGQTYADLFHKAFGTPEVTPVRIAMALASYQRTLVSDRARIDNFPVGFTPQERLGGDIFDMRCSTCHRAPLFTTNTFRNIGLRPPAEDLGLGALTGDAADAGKFRVPSLRNVSLRSSLMHNGQFSSLEEVVDFYDRGGDFSDNQDPFIAPIGLSVDEKAALIAYLVTFTDNRVAIAAPPFDRPRLFTEREPEVPVGDGTMGSGGFMPRAVVQQPPSLLNPQFTVGLTGALGGAPAVFVAGLASAPVGIDVQGARLFVDLNHPWITRFTGFLPGAGPGLGFASVVFNLTTLPPDVVGMKFYGQWLVGDRGSPASYLSASDAFVITMY
jgi:cytochrome c peroxidase